jgi:hypothetical protein
MKNVLTNSKKKSTLIKKRPEVIVTSNLNIEPQALYDIEINLLGPKFEEFLLNIIKKQSEG